MKKKWMLTLFAAFTLAACGQQEETVEKKQESEEAVTLKVASLIPPMTEI